MPGDDDRNYLGYSGRARELLENARAAEGARLDVTTSDGQRITGRLIRRYEHGGAEYIVLKLKSGYNIGLDVREISSLAVLEETPRQRPSDTTEAKEIRLSTAPSKTVLLLSTGGTIASRVDYRTGAVKPVIDARDLNAAIPELSEIANVEPEVVFSVFSENLGPKDWQKLSEFIVFKTRQANPNGIVVMLGTDTLAYVSAALSFSLIGLGVPVVCVGAQRSSDRPSSDATLNILAATRFAAESKANGVFVAMHQTESDDSIAIHSGTRVRKNHTSRRSAFQSIDTDPVALVMDRNIEFGQKHVAEHRDPTPSHKLRTSFSDSVALVKFHPGMKAEALDFVTDNRMRGVIVEGTGLGHVSSGIIRKLSDLISNGVFVGIASQCIWGHVDLNVYETGSDLLDIGVVPLSNMLSETAFAKLSWVIANFDKVQEVMLENLRGEIIPRITLGQ